ncbi:MAG: hypothetical protein ACYCXG_11845 [Acidiferrobacter sp.]
MSTKFVTTRAPLVTPSSPPWIPITYDEPTTWILVGRMRVAPVPGAIPKRMTLGVYRDAVDARAEMQAISGSKWGPLMAVWSYAEIAGGTHGRA